MIPPTGVIAPAGIADPCPAGVSFDALPPAGIVEFMPPAGIVGVILPAGKVGLIPPAVTVVTGVTDF